MATPARGMDTDSRQIAVSWDAQKTIEQRGDSVILGYILQDDAEILYQGMDTEYTFEAETGKIYNLRIAARNIYGRGDFSEPLKIRAGAAPAVVQAITSTNIEENKIQISWQQPENEVFEYEVQIYAKNTDSFHTVPALCDGASDPVIESRSCVIESKTLAENYGYHAGDLFIAKIRARNTLGWGVWSRPNTNGATVFKLVPLGRA